MSIAILTDTNSGINEVDAETLGVFVVPMPVIIDNAVYYEGRTLSENQLYTALRNGADVSTSQPSPADLLAQWDELLEKYDEIIYIPMSSGLSSSCATAKGFAEDYLGKVFVVDNHRISVTLKCAVLQAIEMANSGMSAPEIKQNLEDTAFASSIYLAVESLEYLKRGGRVTPAAAAIATVLKIKPILTIQGEKLDAWSKVRGSMRKCEQLMISALKTDWANRYPQIAENELKIGAAGAGLSEQEISEWVKLIKTEFPSADVFYSPLSASIGTHTGPGAVGIGITFV